MKRESTLFAGSYDGLLCFGSQLTIFVRHDFRFQVLRANDLATFETKSLYQRLQPFGD